MYRDVIKSTRAQHYQFDYADLCFIATFVYMVGTWAYQFGGNHLYNNK